jgi:ThiF family
MSQQLINHNTDLKQLRDEGYDLEIISSKFLLVKSIPYVNSNKEVKLGILVSDLNLAGDETVQPNTHVAYFIGGHPCNADGSEIAQIKHSTNDQQLYEGLIVNHSFSAKPIPENLYIDFHHKMETYAALISGQAQIINPVVTAKIFPVVECAENESVFKYADTSSSRAGIDTITRKLQIGKMAIVGIGGTGSYILDLIAKTPIGEIHIFDGDEFLNHNAFRSPGSPSIEELRERKKKVFYFAELYSKMHRNIIPHDHFIDDSNIQSLQSMDFVFLALDKGSSKKIIVEKLHEWSIPFIDVGIGVQIVEDALLGVVRTTTSTNNKRGHIEEMQRISFGEGDENNEYSRNIQIADLNALNASLAVIKWKKLFGFYTDLENEHYSTYTIDGNLLINEDQL